MKRSLWMGLMAASALTQAACDHVADTSRAAQSVTYRAVNDAKSSWREFFTYHPPMPDPLPQTRYCYQMQSDVVCYDSQQAGLTSKLVGFQEGETISWVQPGGGALGVSGGEPVALRPTPKNYSQNPTPSINDFLPDLDLKYHGGTAKRPSASSSTSNTAPVEGVIDVSNLPPINSVAKVGQKIN